jgi:acetyl-CoA synthetase
VAIYMGMVPEVVVAMLACARIGAVHTVVFGGFAADALRERIQDCQAKVVITQDGGYRRGNVLPLKRSSIKALAQPEARASKHVLVHRHLGERGPRAHDPGRDHWWHEIVDRHGQRRRAPRPPS